VTQESFSAWLIADQVCQTPLTSRGHGMIGTMTTPWAEIRHSTEPPRDHSDEADPDAGPTPMELALAEADLAKGGTPRRRSR
jgi:hypothetical protein